MELSASAVNAWRLASQWLSVPQPRQAGEVVARLGGVQAQDARWAHWSIGLRTSGGRAQDVERAIEERRIVRTWAFRGTLHYVAAPDVLWLLPILAPTIVARNARRYAQLGLDEPTMTQSSELIGRTLEREGPLVRSEIARVLEREGISAQGQRAPYLLQRAALDGVICHGPPRGSEPTYVHLPEWLGIRAVPDDDREAAALAARYMASHGPATVHDFAWWSGLRITEARTAVDAVPSTVRAGSESQGLWAAKDTGPPEPARGIAHLLPPFDDYLLGYRDRSAMLRADYTKLVNRGGGMLKPTVIVDGTVVGIWGREARSDKMIVTLELFLELDQEESRAVEDAARRYGAFMAMPVDVRSEQVAP